MLCFGRNQLRLTRTCFPCTSLEDLASVMRDRPILAEELGLLLARRIENERQFMDSHRHLEEVQPTSIAEKIRHLFEVPHAEFL